MSAANGRNLDALVGLPPVLDACCGGRMFWFDHGDKRALFCDRRRAFREVDIGTPGPKGRKPLVVEPDMIADFTAMPFPSDSFALVVFDPPHMEKLGATGKYATSYGRLEGDWQGMIRAGFAECFRVLRPEGVLVFKWCEYEIPLSRVLALTPEKPLFGHISGKRQQTHWVCFMKPNPSLQGAGHLVDRTLQGVVQPPNPI
jgi:SAM-dependent methyltransferase